VTVKSRLYLVLFARRSVIVSLFSSILLVWIVPAWAHNELPPLLREVDFEQRLNEQVPLDLVFRDETGRVVQLGDYFGAKPVILDLAYYECPMLCPMVLDGLLSSLRALPFNVGDQFDVLTVSFNPKDTVELAAGKKAVYVQRYSRPGAAEGWHFLTGEPDAIQRLTQAIGFRYAYDSAQAQYAHAAGIIVLTAQGKIARYFYGIEYAPRDLRLSLVEASANEIGSPLDQLLLFCYHYDPVTGKYGAAILNMMQLTGLATVLALGIFIIVMFRREQRKLRLNP
jgi:protein SCO1/2